MRISECLGCGKPIIWATSSSGAKIPLDARAQVYRVSENATGAVEAIKVTDSYVTHFATCSKAAQFSKGGRT